MIPGQDKLLTIEPQELHFPFELDKNPSSTIQLSNNTQKRVAFKVMTTTPEKYLVQPKTGILLPIATCVIRVTMLGPKEAPINMQCKDKFLIKSVLASPGATSEVAHKLFNEPGHDVANFKLRVVYSLPSPPQLSERSTEGCSLDMSTAQEGNLNDSEKVVHKVDNDDDWLMKTIIIGLIGLIFCFFFMKMLSFIWSFTLLMTMLVMKMINKLVSDSVEDWVLKTLIYICTYFISKLFPS